MQFNVLINQSRALEWGLNSQQAMLFAFLYELPSWATPVVSGGETYYHIAKGKVVDEMPLLTDKPDTVYRLMRQLAEKGVIKLSSSGPRTLISLTGKGRLWNREAKATSEKYPTNLGEISEVTSEKYPTDQLTSNQLTKSPIADSGDSAPRKQKRSAPSKPLTDNFQPNDTNRKVAAESGVSIDRELPQFIDYHIGKGSTMKDWNRAFNTWLRRAKAYQGDRRPEPTRASQKDFEL